MQGIKQRVENNKLILEIDLAQNFGDSTTGKSIKVASSAGFQKVPGDEGVVWSLNVNRSKKGSPKG